MPRTTLKLDPDLLKRLRQKAAAEGKTLQAVANDLLRQAIYPPRYAEQRYELQLHGWKAAEQPGVDLTDRDKLFDLMDGR